MITSMQRDPPVIRWLKRREAAEYLGTSTRTIDKIINRMKTDWRYERGVIKYGGIVRISEKKLTEYMLKETP